MKNKRKRRIISVIMSFLMLVSVIPADFGAVTVNASTGGNGTAVNWSASDLLAATPESPDNGLALYSGEGESWTLNQAGDDLEFEDGFPVKGDNAKAGSTKAKIGTQTAKGEVPDNGAYLKYDATEDGTLSVYAKVGANKTFYIVGSDGSKVEKPNGGTSSIYSIVQAEVKAGVSYYAYLGGATAQIWKAVYEPVSNATQVEWSRVPAPVINSVQVEDGQFVVDFSAVIDKISGADNARVTMCYDGNEVDSVNLTAQKSQVTFTPGWSGNYTFKVVAQRLGEPDKPSKEYTFENYVLAVAKPVIEMAQNLGAGSVYLDWINVEDADAFDVEYRMSGSEEYTSAAKAIKDGNYTLTGLTVGKEYDFRITAIRNSDGYRSAFEKNGFQVTAEAEQKWYFATVGSAQETNATITDESGDVKQSVALSSQDTSAKKENVAEGEAVANTSNKLTMEGSSSGKISDGEEGFQYYYTMINPNTQNFELSATFTITDTSLTPDNQTGFGLIATDMLGINYYGEPDYVHKYFNSVSNQAYSVKSGFLGMRVITGYDSPDTTSFDGVTRNTYQDRYKNANATFNQGDRYTFTLKKTNDAYVASYNGEEKTYSDLSALSVQEDGSICVGVFVARKVTVEITNMQFSTSESTGVGSGAIEKKITPNVQIMSSGTTGSSDYEYTYYPNVAGKLTVNAPDGSKVYDSDVEAYQVVRVKVPLTAGKNTINSTLVPDKAQSLTSYDNINKSTEVEYQVIGNNQSTVYVSPDGKADGDGSKENPLDIYTVTKYAHPGQYIVLLNGTYTGSNVEIGRSVSGTEQNPITMVAEDVNKVIFEGISLNVTGSYWHIYGVYIHKPTTVGIQIAGNYNTIEMCTVEGSQNTGIQISRLGGAENKAGREEMLWPSYNLVKNCESFDNCDPGRNDADGFAAKLTSGDGNKFYGCISHNNIDDGWDLFAKTISGEIGAVTIENCVAYNNGWLTTDDTSASDYIYGEGNGFKLGGSYMKGGHILKNSVSFNNHAKGITSNSCPDVKIYNCTAFNNSVDNTESYNVALNTKASNLKEWVVEGLISMADPKDTTHEDMIPFSLSSEDNFIYNGSSSYNNQGVEAVKSWFESTDVTKTPTRNPDGTINMNGLLVLNASAPANSGGRLDVTSDSAKSVKPLAPVPTDPGTKPDDGNTNNPGDGNGNNTDDQSGQGGNQQIVDNNNNQADNQAGQDDVNGGNGAASSSQSTPATGDRTPLVALIIFVVISGGVFIKFILTERKKRRE